MNIHDAASLTFLVPFSVVCVADVFFGYVVYPLFLTHTLFMYMSLDLVWNYFNPHSYQHLIICHHVVCLLALSRALMYPEEAFLVSLCGLVEIDTSLLTLRRLLPHSSALHELVDISYRVSNVVFRVFYETFLTALIIQVYSYHSILVKLFVYPLQFFINIFSCGICVLTYSKRNPALKNSIVCNSIMADTPKRKPNAYINFVKKMRPKVVKDFPDLTFAEIGSKLGELWRALTDDEKKKYVKA